MSLAFRPAIRCARGAWTVSLKQTGFGGFKARHPAGERRARPEAVVRIRDPAVRDGDIGNIQPPLRRLRSAWPWSAGKAATRRWNPGQT
jgi:hypothetical protein